jgi:hypothetical protein
MYYSRFLAILFAFFMVGLFNLDAQTTTPATPTPPSPAKKWYESINLRGYTQIRYNGLYETNSKLGCEQCDRNWGGVGGFSIRRMRLIFSGNVGDRVFLYIQPDGASSAGTTQHILQLRDAYADISIDADKEFRFRVGQSKIPFGFENMQSSQNRLSLDRDDAINSAASNERDLGVAFYWASKAKRELFKHLVDGGLKGSGDYGVFGIGIFNGQTANRPEANKNKHIVAHLTYPHKFANGQIIEAGIQGFSGKSTINTVSAGKGVKFQNDNSTILDQRVGGLFILYAQPIGLNVEYNVGVGPEYNPATNIVEQQDLKGGYALLSYKTGLLKSTIIPFAKYTYYDGGKKFELDARSHEVKEWELGIECQINKNFEIVAQYQISHRKASDATIANYDEKGQVLRIQAQINY